MESLSVTLMCTERRVKGHRSAVFSLKFIWNSIFVKNREKHFRNFQLNGSNERQMEAETDINDAKQDESLTASLLQFFSLKNKSFNSKISPYMHHLAWRRMEAKHFPIKLHFNMFC